MGVLNEYIRGLPGAVRSSDPLMSVAALGEDLALVRDIGRHSVGAGSTFDLLHCRKGATFLFLGASPSKCLTYVHYVEERFGVPYRYNRDFAGDVTDAAGTRRETWTLFVRYRNVIPSDRGEFEQALRDRGLVRTSRCGNGLVHAIDEPAVYETGMEVLGRDIDFLLAEPYPREGLDPRFEVKNMVAL
jgi:aminoglycoside 3-N-acetyltransferase